MTLLMLLQVAQESMQTYSIAHAYSAAFAGAAATEIDDSLGLMFVASSTSNKLLVLNITHQPTVTQIASISLPTTNLGLGALNLFQKSLYAQMPFGFSRLDYQMSGSAFAMMGVPNNYTTLQNSTGCIYKLKNSSYVVLTGSNAKIYLYDGLLGTMAGSYSMASWQGVVRYVIELGFDIYLVLTRPNQNPPAGMAVLMIKAQGITALSTSYLNPNYLYGIKGATSDPVTSEWWIIQTKYSIISTQYRVERYNNLNTSPSNSNTYVTAGSPPTDLKLVQQLGYLVSPFQSAINFYDRTTLATISVTNTLGSVTPDISSMSSRFFVDVVTTGGVLLSYTLGGSYYLDMLYIPSPPACTTIPNCALCPLLPTVCQRCSSPPTYFLKNTTLSAGTPTVTCISGTVPAGYGTNASYPLLLVAPCLDVNCATCTADFGVCTACSSGYYLYLGVCYLPAQLPAGIGANAAFQTGVNCSVANCFNCSLDYSSCLTCNLGYYFYSTNGSCLSPPQFPSGLGLLTSTITPCVDANCFNCAYNNSNCVVCNSGYLVSNSICIVNPGPACTDINCVQCPSNVSVCQTCNAITYLLISNFTCVAYSAIPAQYGVNGSSAIPCSNPQCQTCTANYATCNTCTSGLYLSGTSCISASQIPPGQGIDTVTSQIAPCSISNCNNCTLNIATCSSCTAGNVYLSSSGSCTSLSSIPSGSGVCSGSIQPCADLNCQDCAANCSNCSTCSSPYYSTPNGTCISEQQIPPGFGIVPGTNTIASCTDRNCINCPLNIGNCITCDPSCSILSGMCVNCGSSESNTFGLPDCGSNGCPDCTLDFLSCVIANSTDPVYSILVINMITSGNNTNILTTNNPKYYSKYHWTTVPFQVNGGDSNIILNRISQFNASVYDSSNDVRYNCSDLLCNFVVYRARRGGNSIVLGFNITFEADNVTILGGVLTIEAPASLRSLQYPLVAYKNMSHVMEAASVFDAYPIVISGINIMGSGGQGLAGFAATAAKTMSYARAPINALVVATSSSMAFYFDYLLGLLFVVALFEGPSVAYPDEILQHSLGYQLFPFQVPNPWLDWAAQSDCQTSNALNNNGLMCNILGNSGSSFVQLLATVALNLLLNALCLLVAKWIRGWLARRGVHLEADFLAVRYAAASASAEELGPGKAVAEVAAEKGGEAKQSLLMRHGKKIASVMKEVGTVYGLQFSVMKLDGNQLPIVLYAMVNLRHANYDQTLKLGTVLAAVLIAYFALVTLFSVLLAREVWAKLTAALLAERQAKLDAPLAPNDAPADSAKPKDRGLDAYVDVGSSRYWLLGFFFADCRTPKRFFPLLNPLVCFVRSLVVAGILVFLADRPLLQLALGASTEGLFLAWMWARDLRANRGEHWMDVFAEVAVVAYVALKTVTASAVSEYLRQYVLGLAMAALLVAALLGTLVCTAAILSWTAYRKIRELCRKWKESKARSSLVHASTSQLPADQSALLVSGVQSQAPVIASGSAVGKGTGGVGGTGKASKPRKLSVAAANNRRASRFPKPSTASTTPSPLRADSRLNQPISPVTPATTTTATTSASGQSPGEGRSLKAAPKPSVAGRPSLKAAVRSGPKPRIKTTVGGGQTGAPLPQRTPSTGG